MLSLLSEIHFLSCQEDIIIKHTDYGSFKYYSKKETTEPYQNGKKSYCEERNMLWNPNNKRPFKLKERLKELEEHLLQNKVVCFSCEDNNVQLLLSKGLLINITVNSNTCDIVRVNFNRTITSKVHPETICYGVIVGQQVACILTDGRVLCQGGMWREGWLIDGGSRRRLNLYSELLVLWGRSSAEHPQPWSPLAKDHQRANLNFYWVGARGPELLAYKKTEGEPIEIVVSKLWNKTLIVVEQKVSQRGAVSVEVSTLELNGKALKRSSVTSVPLQTQVSCCSISQLENHVLLGCIDGSVALLDRNRGSTRIVKASFIPTLAVWHCSGVTAAISNEKGQVQYFDTALNCVKTQLAGEDCTPVSLLDFSSYFNAQQTLTSIKWGPKDLIVAFEYGPLAVIKHCDTSLSFVSLAQRYLTNGKIDNAIALLLTWEWDNQCFTVLQRIVAYLMKQPLSEENAQHLQNALGSFHSPAVPLTTVVRHRYGSQVRALTRRFFHQLVRYSMFETAFLLAVDIGHHDLFMDLYYCAVRIGEREMAAAARAQASALLSRCSSAASCCSRSSCSQCSGSESCSEECSSPDAKEDPPNSFVISQYTPAATNLPVFNDNYLTTNFNNINPKTYKPVMSYNSSVPSIPNVDLPKVSVSVKPPLSKLQPLSQLLSASHSISASATCLNTPPLPITPPLPSLNANLMSQIGIPYSNFQNFSSTSRSLSTTSLSYLSRSSFTPLSPGQNPPIRPNFTNFPPSTNFSTSAHFNTPPSLSSPHLISTKFSIPPTTTIQQHLSSPPLPVAPPLLHHLPQSATQAATQPATTNCGKKPQAKVKFSDTVTAFIVPEVKRPVRPPPPPHITDPQKELADSLPLCHPNEDYLKDFTPIRRSEPDETPTQSKIKVVHFGVV